MSTPDAASLAAMQALYDRGLYLQAYRAAEPHGPLRDWRGPEARVLAGRLAGVLEARRTADAIFLCAHREHPRHPSVTYYYIWALYSIRGPLPALQALERYEEPADLTPTLRADFEALRGELRAEFRDFDAAAGHIARAEALLPDSAWIQVEKARVLGKEDRYEEALAAARRALELRPGYVSALHMAAHYLQLTGRDADALALLTEAVQHTESGALLYRLVELQEELGFFPQARASLDRLKELWPLMEASTAKWLAGRRADLAYYAGDYDAARVHCADAGAPFYPKFAEALAGAPPAPRRVLLKVEFVRQHHMTCGPATLSALARYWSVPVDHLEVAEEICYNGTTDVNERRWAVEHGFVARHFRLTWDSAVALLDRGVPFALSTVETGSAHLQAIIGYDAARATFLVRDPTVRKLGEFKAEETLAHYASSGPLATVLVPAERAELLAGIELPDAELYDIRFEVECALRVHDRDAAEAAVRRMEAARPGHRLTLFARASIASYDSDPATQLACTEKVAAEFPEADHLLLACGSHMRQLGRGQEYHEKLRARALMPAADPVVIREYVDVLRAESQELPHALERMTWPLRRTRTDGSFYHILAHILWDLRRQDEAFGIYRLAACLEDRNEHYVWSFFAAARHLKRTEEALAFLRRRFERFGAKSSGPIKTLVAALSDLDRDVEAFASLEQGLARRPDDGELLLHAADIFARYSDFARAEALRQRARGKCRHADWLRTAAKAAHLKGELGASLDLWRQVLALEPLAVDAHRAVAARLEETAGQAAAITHLTEAAARFSRNHALHELLIEWLRCQDDHAAYEEAARRLCALDPKNAWARRELALALSRQQRYEEALVQVDKTASIDSHSPPYYNVKGAILARAGRREEARAQFRHAITLDVDDDYAIEYLMRMAETPSDRRAELAFVHDALVRQTMFGSGLLEYLRLASGAIGAEELLAFLEEALAARPDLWHAWVAVVRQLASMDRLEEAGEKAREMVERFPLVPRAWLDLADVCRLRGDRDGELAALSRARELQPGWSVAAHMLVDVYDREGRFAECRPILEQAVAREPLSPVNHGYLADVLWKLGDKDAALEHLRRAVTLDPGYSWAWERLREWAEKLGKKDLVLDVARDLTARRGGEARSWLIFARVCDEERVREALDALDRAIALDARNIDAHDLRALLLATSGRFDEALAACRPATWGDAPPAMLGARAAWVEAQRGRLEDAIERVRSVLADDPSLFWGWARLADWAEERKDRALVLEAVTHMSELRPNDHVVLGYLGDARQKSDDTAGAKAALARASALRPDYLFAGNRLFELELKDGELAEAQATLARITPHMDADEAASRAIELLAHRGALQEGERELAALLRMGDASYWSIENAARALQEKGSRSVDALIEARLEEGEAPKSVASFYVQRLFDRKDRRRAQELLRELPEGTPAWNAAADAYLRAVAQPPARRDAVRFVRRFGKALGADNTLWGLAGYALTASGAHARCVRWMRDYRARADVKSWMLANLANSLRYLHRDEEAYALSEAALALPFDGDNRRSVHEAPLAIDDVIAHRFDLARARLGRINENHLEPSERFALDLGALLIDAADARIALTDARRRMAAHITRELGDLFGIVDHLKRRYACRFVWSLARLARDPFTRLWALWRLLLL